MNKTEIADFIHQVRAQDRLSLTEAESKSILNAYGIPVVEEHIVMNEDEAIIQSQRIGFPVVLKGLGAKLTHKTERGLVKGNLKSDDEIRRAFQNIREAAGVDLEACLIQPLIEGKREFVAGLSRDPQFGPVVMFGLGGIFTEAVGDVTFRIAPLDKTQAGAMLDEIKARKMIGAFRGEAPADKNQLVDILIGLSSLVSDFPDIKEIDINPLIVTADGRIKAVDALVILADADDMSADINANRDEKNNQEKEIQAALAVMTHAQSIAVIGATPPRKNYPGIFECVRSFGFSGRLYPVNKKFTDINGIKCYQNLSSLPEKVDLVIVSIPAPLVPEALRECVATGNKNVHIFTAGFKESGEKEGIRLQEEMEKIAREGGLHVVGPNCMGFYVPSSRMLTWTGASKESGPVSLISQSGANAQDFTNYTSSNYGIHFSKCISYGNALTLECADFVNYLANDDETRFITMYLEGVRDGQKLLRHVRDVNKRKPVIIYKSGLTESGARAVSSHTGSMAGGEKIWQAFFRQTGAVQVESLEEMADVLLAFHHLGTSPGRKTAVLGIGGGNGVAVADNCAKAGLELPVLPPEVIHQLKKTIAHDGAMVRNPIDSVSLFVSLPLMGDTLELLAESSEIDNFILSIPIDLIALGMNNYAEIVAQYLVAEGRKRTHGKPLIIVWRQYQPDPIIKQSISVMEDIFLSAGIPVYQGLSRAASALSKLVTYGEYCNEGHLI